MTTQGFPSAAQSVPVAMLALATLADLRSWLAGPAAGLRGLPIEAMAISAAAISPWRSPAQLAPTARMFVWAYALDNHMDRVATDLAELDDLLDRCRAVVRTGAPDTSHPLLSALSSCQRELSRQPLYPALADLWVAKFDGDLRGCRYDWLAGRSEVDRTDVADYLAHATSISQWISHFPMWATYGEADLLDHLDVLVAALDDLVVAIRLVNDLATFPRESAGENENNILMYEGVTEEWVRAELVRWADSAVRRLSPLVEQDFPPAVELIRLLEWSTGFYSCGDFRGWGSDAPVTPATGHPPVGV
ncbi:hypothetical protein [Kutzneria sp. NPDC052558]|uniref:terpene synthase family protein n=1 Tax=Kutzneria sp. NPDC052558 TaxID=3364121 RepID=UPI0037C775D5